MATHAQQAHNTVDDKVIDLAARSAQFLHVSWHDVSREEPQHHSVRQPHPEQQQVCCQVAAQTVRVLFAGQMCQLASHLRHGMRLAAGNQPAMVDLHGVLLFCVAGLLLGKMQVVLKTCEMWRRDVRSGHLGSALRATNNTQ